MSYTQEQIMDMVKRLRLNGHLHEDFDIWMQDAADMLEQLVQSSERRPNQKVGSFTNMSEKERHELADVLEAEVERGRVGEKHMTDKEAIAQMEALNWKPAVQYWKEKSEKLQKELTSVCLDYLAADGQAAENLHRALEAEKKLDEAMSALKKVQVFVKDLEPYADQGHTLVPSLQYACEVYNKLKGD